MKSQHTDSRWKTRAGAWGRGQHMDFGRQCNRNRYLGVHCQGRIRPEWVNFALTRIPTSATQSFR